MHLGGGADRGKVLEKLLELFGHMPDKEDAKDGGLDEKAEGEPPIKGAEIAMVGIHPGGHKMDPMSAMKKSKF